jgi:hypothetical protein
MRSTPWEVLSKQDRDGFTVIVEKLYEECHPRDLFDTSINPDTGRPYYDVDQICRDIDSGDLDWFILRVRVLLDGVELGSDVVGGFLYEDARDVLTDGVAEDMIWTAMSEAEKRVVKLADTFSLKAMQLSVDKQAIR